MQSMGETSILPEQGTLDQLTQTSGLALAVIDPSSREILISNNNSICDVLNPDGVFSAACSQFCGKAFAAAEEAGGTISFECHAGLECRAVSIGTATQPLVAIAGRTFLKADNYRRATERAITGDWRQLPPADLFANVLLSGSATALDKSAANMASTLSLPNTAEVPKTAPPALPESKAEKMLETKPERSRTVSSPILRQLDEPPKRTHALKRTPSDLSALVERFNREVGLQPTLDKPAEEVRPVKEVPAVAPVKERVAAPAGPAPETPPVPETAPIDNEKRAAEAQAWRSFFGSLLKTDYDKAIQSILEFIGHQHQFKSLLWLEKRNGQLTSTAAFGDMKNRKIRLGIAADDERLVEALNSDKPLELGERPKGDERGSKRQMHLFPIGVGGEISSAIAILDDFESEAAKNQIARICHSIAPQLEILRLRSEIAVNESLTSAVRKFSESLKTIDSDDGLFYLTQNAAEFMRAERASLMLFDEKAKMLEIKAIIGSRGFRPNGDVGTRVANVVFTRNVPVVVADVARTSLPPAPADREYKTASFLSCPIVIGSRTIGVMNFADRASGQAFDRPCLELFQAIAPQLAVAIDRASLKEKAGEFEQLSVTDALTGLLNRRYIEERLMEEIKRSNRHGFPMSFMMLDVDNFKSYNDKFGHPAGDEALKLVGNVIRETLRGADVAARFGGEEFSILLPQTTADEAAAIAERIRYNVEVANFRHRVVTISIGIASCSAELCSAANIVSAADKALYEAKRLGRNGVVAFESMGVDPAERID